MSLLLNIETATSICSVALAEDGKILALKELTEGRRHAEVITVFIREAFESAGKKISELDAIAVSMGPGSYTGLRIGVSTAKGLCYALNKPLIAINTLQSMAAGMILREQTDEKGKNSPRLFCPMIDARRMEVYCAVFTEENIFVEKTSAKILTDESFADMLEKNRIVFFGDGALKCKSILKENPHAEFVPEFAASAKFMVPLSHKIFNEPGFTGEDVAYFEPFYLKDFFTVPARKKT